MEGEKSEDTMHLFSTKYPLEMTGPLMPVNPRGFIMSIERDYILLKSLLLFKKVIYVYWLISSCNSAS